MIPVWGSPRICCRNSFSRFARADHSLDRSRGGLGLGLFVVKGLTELHGGEVSAASDGPERGAQFTVRLPLQPEPAALSVPSAALSPASRRRRVLIVEDNRDAADSLRMLLELLGHETRVAYNGPDGVRERNRGCRRLSCATLVCRGWMATVWHALCGFTPPRPEFVC